MSNVESVKTQLSTAGTAGKVVKIVAHRDVGVQTRVVEPYAYTQSSKFPERELLKCYDVEKDGWRNFYVDEIESVSETGEVFEPREDVLV